jgi:hypothetical protein
MNGRMPFAEPNTRCASLLRKMYYKPRARNCNAKTFYSFSLMYNGNMLALANDVHFWLHPCNDCDNIFHTYNEAHVVCTCIHSPK